MPTFSAALFATTTRPNSHEQSLIAHAILKEGSRPCWEVHLNDKIFRFIPDPQHLVMDGLWQLLDYCKIPKEEYAYDVHYNEPITLEEEFGHSTCIARRADLVRDMEDSGINFSLITWPGADVNMLKQSLEGLNKAGIHLVHQSIAI